ncbi:MAG: permease [Bacteroidales bacterium]|nr:permease [Bacteroidales bacterium]
MKLNKPAIKKKLQKYKFDLPVILLFGSFIGISYLVDFSTGEQLFETTFWQFLSEMLTILPCMFIIIGLFDVWVPKEKLEKHIGKGSGIKGIALMVLLAVIQPGSLYVAFPFAWLLWKKGSSLRNIFIYVGMFSAAKIPMLTFEIAFLGLKFSLLRLLLTIPVFIIIAIILEKQLRNKPYEISRPE